MEKLSKPAFIATIRELFTSTQREIDGRIIATFFHPNKRNHYLKALQKSVWELCEDDSFKYTNFHLEQSFKDSGLDFQRAKIKFKVKSRNYYIFDCTSKYSTIPDHIKSLIIAHSIYSTIYLDLLNEDKLLNENFKKIDKESIGSNSHYLFARNTKETLKDNLQTLADIISIFFQSNHVDSYQDVIKLFELLLSKPDFQLRAKCPDNISLIGRTSLNTIATLRSNRYIFNFLNRDDEGNLSIDHALWRFLLSYNKENSHGGCPASYSGISPNFDSLSSKDFIINESGITSMFKAFYVIYYFVMNNTDILSFPKQFKIAEP